MAGGTGAVSREDLVRQLSMYRVRLQHAEKWLNHSKAEISLCKSWIAHLEKVLKEIEEEMEQKGIPY